MRDGHDVLAAPYLSFTTFRNALDKLKEYNVPTPLDNSFLYTFLNGTNARLFVSALHFFNLIDENRRPTSELEKLATDVDNRKSILKELLKKHYPNVFALDLERTTPGQFDAAFDNFGFSSDTKRKAKTFLVQAMQYTNIPVAEIVTKRTRRPKNAVKKPRKQQDIRETKPAPSTKASSTPEKPKSTTSHSTKTITLRNGDRISLIADVDPFTLHPEDRDFLFGLIDSFKDHEESIENDDAEADFEEGNELEDSTL